VANKNGFGGKTLDLPLANLPLATIRREFPETHIEPNLLGYRFDEIEGFGDLGFLTTSPILIQSLSERIVVTTLPLPRSVSR